MITQALILLIFSVSTLVYFKINIPNANFKAYLVCSIARSTNSGEEIQVLEATSYEGTSNCSGTHLK